MMECMNDPLPCKARLYFDESTSSLPEFLSREIVTVEERRTNSSFLISLELEKHRRGKQTEVKDLIDIPTCIGIDVHILSPLKTKKRYQKLYENTAHLLKEFNLTEVRACVDAPSDDVYVTQAQLLAQCRQGYESVGLNIDTPSIIGEYQPLIPASFDPAPQYEELDVIASKMTKVSDLLPLALCYACVLTPWFFRNLLALSSVCHHQYAKSHLQLLKHRITPRSCHLWNLDRVSLLHIAVLGHLQQTSCLENHPCAVL